MNKDDLKGGGSIEIKLSCACPSCNPGDYEVLQDTLTVKTEHYKELQRKAEMVDDLIGEMPKIISVIPVIEDGGIYLDACAHRHSREYGYYTYILQSEADKLAEALEKTFAAMVTSKFEPDADQPSMLKDGVWDKAVDNARAALKAYRGKND